MGRVRVVLRARVRHMDGRCRGRRRCEALLDADSAIKETRLSSDEQILGTLVLRLCAAAGPPARGVAARMRTLAGWCVVGTMALAVARRRAGESKNSRNTHRLDFARARQLVVNGNGAAGRLLVDSVIAATSPDTPHLR